MRTYAVREGLIAPAKIALYEAMRADVMRLPDLEPAELVSCHALCRALAARHEGATCVDGYFMANGHEHSWIDLGDGIVADMYPIGSQGSLLVDASHWMVPWNRLYIADDEMLDKTGGRRLQQDELAGRLRLILDEMDRTAISAT